MAIGAEPFSIAIIIIMYITSTFLIGQALIKNVFSHRQTQAFVKRSGPVLELIAQYYVLGIIPTLMEK